MTFEAAADSGIPPAFLFGSRFVEAREKPPAGAMKVPPDFGNCRLAMGRALRTKPR